MLGILGAGILAMAMAMAMGCAEVARTDMRPDPAAQRGSAAPPAAAPRSASEGLSEGQNLPVARLVAIALERTPTRSIWEADRAAAAAAVTQAGMFANPEIEIEGGQGRSRPGDTTDSIGRIAVRQRLEFPGKRSSRITAAEATVNVVEVDVAVLTLEVEADVRTAAIDLAATVLAVEQGKHAADIAHQIAEVVHRHAAGGETSRSDALRIDIDQRQSEIDLDQRERAVTAAREALRALCAGTLPEHFTVNDGLALSDLPGLDQALVAVDRHPRVIRLRSIRAQRLAELQREESAGRPDATIGAFAGRGIDGDEIGLSLGIEFPLWNRNQGGISSAQAGLRRQNAEIDATMQDVRRAIVSAWHAAAAAIARRDRTSTEIYPLAVELLSRRLAAYTAGEAALSEALDARRAAQLTDQGLDDSRAEAARALIRLKVAMGTFIPPTARPIPEPKP